MTSRPLLLLQVASWPPPVANEGARGAEASRVSTENSAKSHFPPESSFWRRECRRKQHSSERKKKRSERVNDCLV